MSNVEKIKEYLKEENVDVNIDDSRNKELDDYLMYRAKKLLSSKSGYIDDETVLGWALHFYCEDQESIATEMKSKKYAKTGKIKKTSKPKIKHIDKATGATLIQESLF